MNLFNPNTDYHTSFYDKAKYIMAWRLSLALSIVFLILTIVASTTQDDQLVTTLLLTILIVSTACFAYLNVTKKFTPLFYIYLIIGTILVHVSLNTITEVSHFGDFLWITVLILLAFVGIGNKTGILLILINAIGIFYFYLFSFNHYIITSVERSSSDLINDILDSAFSLFVIGYLLQLYISLNSYSEKELVKANVLLSKKNDENITLVKEIHHRVKNNLQIIISLLRLQKGELESDEEKKHFTEAINRIMVMSLIHEKLYQEKELNRINVQSYLIDLAEDIQSISELSFPVKISVNSGIKDIGLNTIVPLGLLINELLTNSFKHAFSNKKDGKITINIENTDDNNFNLKYADNGKWKENNESSGFGIGLIETLTEQLEGKSTRKQSTYTFTIKDLDQ